MTIISISTLLVLFLVYKSHNFIQELKKKQVVEAEVTSFNPHFKINVDENVNFLLTVNLYLPNSERKQINVKGLYLKSPKKGDKIKILLNDADINQSKIFIGTEITNVYITIFVFCMTLFSIYYFSF